ncbi:hypothetical protein L2E82_53730 [Cichorium intybus]|nr:hypothetical protein L2E82_53730 [Cichorium intybus]
MGGEFGYGLATDTDTRLEEASTGRSALEAYLSISSLCDGSRHLSQAFFASGVEIYMMHPSGGEITPSNSGSSRTEDSFGIQVLMEPFSETEMGGTSGRSSIPRVDEAGPPPLVHDFSLESSMRNRIVRLEQGESPYLLDKAKGAYWADIKLELDHAPSQREYNRLLEFENRDLHIREKKTESFRLFQAVLERNPTLADQAPYNPQEAFNDFLDQHRDRLDHRELEVDVGERDKAEIAFLNIVIKGLKENGASYVRRIFQ